MKKERQRILHRQAREAMEDFKKTYKNKVAQEHSRGCKNDP